MWLYKDCQKLVPLFLVATYNLKHLMAIQDPLLSREVEETARLDQVGHFPRDEPGESAAASTGPTVRSQSHDGGSVTIQDRIRKAAGSVWTKLNTFIFGTPTKLPDHKKIQIHKQLEANREEIMAMKTEYESLLQSIKDLENIMFRQWAGWIFTRSGYTFSILRKLKIYHQRCTLTLVQNRIYELAGIGTRMSMIESVSHPKPWGFSWKIKLGELLPFILSYCAQMKRAISDVRVLTKSPSIQGMRKSLKKVKLLGELFRGSSPSTHHEYEKQIRQDMNPMISTTKQEMHLSSTPPTILSGDHLRIVKEKVNIRMLQDLRKFLHTVSFQMRCGLHPTEEWPFSEMMVSIKVGYEKCAGFQVLALLHNFKLITQKELNSFFESNDTLELTARHLFGIFLEKYNPLTAYHTLIPDMNFITNDWHTQHLRYLKDLDEEKQGYILYTILKQASTNWIWEMQNISSLNFESGNVFNFFGRESFLREMKEWSPKPWNKITRKPQEDLMRQILEKIISFFIQLPVNQVSSYKMKALFLINYYILKFIKKYGNENVGSFIDAYVNNESNSRYLIGIYGEQDGQPGIDTKFGPGHFKKQFGLITCGLEVHQLINRIHDYEYFLSYPDSFMHVIPNWITRESQEELKNELSKLEKKFWSALTDIHELSKNNIEIKKWIDNLAVKDILEKFQKVIKNSKPHYNLWLSHVTNHANTEPRTQIGSHYLAAHLRDYYNVFDKFTEESKDSYDKLKEGLLSKASGRCTTTHSD